MHTRFNQIVIAIRGKKNLSLKLRSQNCNLYISQRINVNPKT